jgi:hypothetical protein
VRLWLSVPRLGLDERDLPALRHRPGLVDAGPRPVEPERYLMCITEIARAITSCWISVVPSKMS